MGSADETSQPAEGQGSGEGAPGSDGGDGNEGGRGLEWIIGGPVGVPWGPRQRRLKL